MSLQPSPTLTALKTKKYVTSCVFLCMCASAVFPMFPMLSLLLAVCVSSGFAFRFLLKYRVLAENVLKL